MSNLSQYAEKEMRRAGLYDKDCDYGPGVIAKCILKMINAFSSYGHSGGSAEITLAIFDRLVRFQPLTALTRNPNEWMDVSKFSGNQPMWQSHRQPSCFSTDGGRTYYNLDEGKEHIYTSAEPSPSQ